MKVILFLLLMLISFSSYSNCKVLDHKSLKIKWTAFKTPLKVGVSGHLDNFDVSSKKGKSIFKALEETSISIKTNAKSVNTKNKARDAKISKFFFEDKDINAKVLSANKKKIKLAITLFDNLVNVELKPTVEKSMLTAKGFIDILDFKGNKQLAALNKACFAKHEGKTWSDVEIQVSAKFKNCK